MGFCLIYVEQITDKHNFNSVLFSESSYSLCRMWEYTLAQFIKTDHNLQKQITIYRYAEPHSCNWLLENMSTVSKWLRNLD